MNPYSVAQAKIAAALADLEKATDCWVESVLIRDTEITSVHDHRRKVARQVQINVRERPGSGWAQQAGDAS